MAVKLGNGNWAVKEDKLLAYNDNSGLFFNKEFDFSRGTSATYVAKDGLIKTAGIQPNVVNNGDFSELGSELVTNGTFDTDSNWTKSNATISGGKATITVTGGGFSQIFQSVSFSSGSQYRITAQVQGLSGSSGKNIRFQDNGSNNGGLSTANGVITLDESVQNIDITWTANSNSNEIVIARSTTSGDYSWTIDNISVKNIAPNWEIEGNSTITVGTYEGRSNVANINILNTSVSSRIRQPFNYVNGKKYKVTVNVFLVSGSFRIDSSDSFVSGDFVSTSTTGSWLTLSAEIDALRTGSNYIWLRSLSEVSQFYVDSVSVQEIQTDTPRIDFTNDTKGHLLLEPSSTNLLTYSEDFTQWDKNSGTTITSNSVISPDGTQNATKVVSAGTGSRVGLNTSIVSGTTYTLSVYLKNNGGNTSVSIGSHGTTQLETVTINNEWNRYTTTFVASSTTTSSIRINSSGSNINLYAWGAMLETKGYATSYIPTTGTTSTRNADVCNNSGSAQDFNSEEGVLYAEISALDDDLTNRQISINNGTTTDRVQLFYSGSSNQISIFYKAQNGTTQFSLNETLSDITEFNKIAFKWKTNDFALWINGVETDTVSSGVTSTANSLTNLDFNQFNGGADFYGKVRNVQVFTEALTDEQLQELTS